MIYAVLKKTFSIKISLENIKKYARNYRLVSFFNAVATEEPRGGTCPHEFFRNEILKLTI